MKIPSPRPARALRPGVLLLLALGLCSEIRPIMPVRGQQPKPQDKPFVAEYYYKARWGHADEFIRLFKKNHLPVLKKQIETGRILRVTAVKPRYHATEDGRWDYRVTIVFKDVSAASHDSSGEEAIKKELFPDQEAFKREEQRRFEILLGHWDVPIEDVDLDQ